MALELTAPQHESGVGHVDVLWRGHAPDLEAFRTQFVRPGTPAVFAGVFRDDAIGAIDTLEAALPSIGDMTLPMRRPYHADGDSEVLRRRSDDAVSMTLSDYFTAPASSPTRQLVSVDLPTPDRKSVV